MPIEKISSCIAMEIKQNSFTKKRMIILRETEPIHDGKIFITETELKEVYKRVFDK